MVGSDGKYQLVNARIAPQGAPMTPPVQPATPPPLVLPRKTLWERAKDLASTMTAIGAAVAIAGGVVWYVAKPAIDAQYCTVAHARTLEDRVDKHEIKQLATEADLAKALDRVGDRLKAIEAHLCLMAAGGKEREIDKCLRVQP